MATNEQALEIHSAVFAQNGHIPPTYTCEGKDVNPPLEIGHIPEGTKTLALIMEDPDAPNGVFDHWLVWNITPGQAIAEAGNPGTSGTNSFGKTGYGGPCPPSGAHRYYFNIYALDVELGLLPGAHKLELLKAMEGHVLARGSLMGFFKRAGA